MPYRHFSHFMHWSSQRYGQPERLAERLRDVIDGAVDAAMDVAFAVVEAFDDAVSTADTDADAATADERGARGDRWRRFDDWSDTD